MPGGGGSLESDTMSVLLPQVAWLLSLLGDKSSDLSNGDSLSL